MTALIDLATLPLMEVWGDDVRARKLEGGRITMTVIELAPGAIVPEHHHHQEQLGICIQGSVRFRVGDEVRELGPGGTWRIEPDVPHAVEAGPEGAVAIDVFSPIRSDWAFPELAPRPPRWPTLPGR
jgi:quercetin dioxygenase-like cupin family protein